MPKMQNQIVDRNFDMWRDYMNLGSLLKRLCDMRLEERRGPGESAAAAAGASARAAAAAEVAVGAPGGHTQMFHRETSRNAPATSSASSPSDASSTGASSDSDLCYFCKQNGESPPVYRSHTLKSADGRVVCPVLWSYACPICGATGDFAHTRQYCPVARRRDARKHAGNWF